MQNLRYRLPPLPLGGESRESLWWIHGFQICRRLPNLEKPKVGRNLIYLLNTSNYTYSGYLRRRELSTIMRRANSIAFWLPVRLSMALRFSWAISRAFRSL